MNHNQIIGDFGEQLARNYLTRHGYGIIASKVRLGYQELDIVARQRGLIVFVEVKTRVSQVYGPAENALFFTKLARFKKAIEIFIKNKKISSDDIRADLITVDLDRLKRKAKIKHYQDII